MRFNYGDVGKAMTTPWDRNTPATAAGYVQHLPASGVWNETAMRLSIAAGTAEQGDIGDGGGNFYPVRWPVLLGY